MELLTFLILTQNHIIKNHIDKLHMIANNHVKVKEHMNRLYMTNNNTIG